MQVVETWNNFSCDLICQKITMSARTRGLRPPMRTKNEPWSSPQETKMSIETFFGWMFLLLSIAFSMSLFFGLYLQLISIFVIFKGLAPVPKQESASLRNLGRKDAVHWGIGKRLLSGPTKQKRGQKRRKLDHGVIMLLQKTMNWYFWILYAFGRLFWILAILANPSVQLSWSRILAFLG